MIYTINMLVYYKCIDNKGELHKSGSPFTYQKRSKSPYFAPKSRTIKLYGKQYITVDNTHQLLYTVYRKGEKKICILY